MDCSLPEPTRGTPALPHAGLEDRWPAAHTCDMGAGWKFLGEFKRGRKESLSLECIVALSDRNAAEEIARKKLVGADNITAVELSRAELVALKIKQGDVRFSE
jgi:hypothetical protein